jgi:hypothetical protein
MYPTVTQFETRDAELRDRFRLDAELRAARAAKDRSSKRRPKRLRTLLGALVRSG